MGADTDQLRYGKPPSKKGRRKEKSNPNLSMAFQHQHGSMPNNSPAGIKANLNMLQFSSYEVDQ